MWMSSEDARSDFILAAAGMGLGTEVVFFLQGFSLYPGGLVGRGLTVLWVFLLTVVVARFFVSYRQQGLEGYGLQEDRAGLTEGMLVAAPLAIAGYVRGIEEFGPFGALLGRAGPVVSGPTVEPTDSIELVLAVALILVGALGAMMMYGLLTTRARDAFRSVDMPLVQALRTFGLGAVGVGTLLGLLVSASPGGLPVTSPLLDGVALAATVLLADRAVDGKDRTQRATVLAPAIAALVVSVLVSGGGLFGPGLVVALWRGTVAGAIVIVVATLIETRRAAWAAVPLVFVAMWSPTCTMLPVGGRGLGGCL